LTRNKRIEGRWVLRQTLSMQGLWDRGYARLGKLLARDECEAIRGLYSNPEQFRSQIEMKRYRFGSGEYQYFRYPLPERIGELRQQLYARLAPVATAWMATLKADVVYPVQLDEFLARCHKAGQTRPTPLLLRYREGDCNCLHQDLYGEIFFPFQVVTCLSKPDEEFTGGELLLVEQQPRAQSTGHAIRLEQRRERCYHHTLPACKRHTRHLSHKFSPRRQPDSLWRTLFPGSDLSRRYLIKGATNMTSLNETQCWQALNRRDPAFDGRFFVAIKTTRVFCRPSCPSRRARPENVRFYTDAAAAERDGFRPCLRCRPLATVDRDPNAERVREICRYIEQHYSERLTLGELADRAGLSRFHFQRSFLAIAGVTPKQYIEACRLQQFKAGLRRTGDVAGSTYDAGFGSSSRVYERADTRLGMTPKQYLEGGANLIISYAFVDSPVGKLLIGATDRGVCFVQFGETEDELLRALESEYPAALLESMKTPAAGVFRQWIAALSAHLAGRQPHLDLPLDIRATAFQMRVWNYLQSIPYGQVRTYKQVAEAIGQPTAARAVANACAGNTIAILIPCHRVIRGSGELGGYRWGVPRKKQILETERNNVT